MTRRKKARLCQRVKSCKTSCAVAWETNAGDFLFDHFFFTFSVGFGFDSCEEKYLQESFAKPFGRPLKIRCFPKLGRLFHFNAQVKFFQRFQAIPRSRSIRYEYLCSV